MSIKMNQESQVISERILTKAEKTVESLYSKKVKDEFDKFQCCWMEYYRFHFAVNITRVTSNSLGYYLLHNTLVFRA